MGCGNVLGSTCWSERKQQGNLKYHFLFCPDHGENWSRASNSICTAKWTQRFSARKENHSISCQAVLHHSITQHVTCKQKGLILSHSVVIYTWGSKLESLWLVWLDCSHVYLNVNGYTYQKATQNKNLCISMHKLISEIMTASYNAKWRILKSYSTYTKEGYFKICLFCFNHTKTRIQRIFE